MCDTSLYLIVAKQGEIRASDNGNGDIQLCAFEAIESIKRTVSVESSWNVCVPLPLAALGSEHCRGSMVRLRDTP